MEKRYHLGFAILTFVALSVIWIIFRPERAQPVADLPATELPDASPTITPYAETSWINLDLPPDATQLERGAEIYRLVCSACHAYDGTGLTDEWRASWTHDAQNCWQSKCHAENHPPDGFLLPDSPAIVGPIIPAFFSNALELNEYNQKHMPWHNPNSLTEEETWAVTAHVLMLNQINPGPHLDAETAPNIQLRP